MPLVFGDVGRCTYCKGRGRSKRGGRSYVCRRCNGKGYVDIDMCWCQCGCNSLTTSVLCIECINDALTNGICTRVSV